MEISKALPTRKYTDALTHSQKPEFINKRNAAIARLKQWHREGIINSKEPPTLLFGYGKDSTAVFLLCRMAGIPFECFSIDNGGDLPQHYQYWAEFDAWAGDFPVAIGKTKERCVDTLKRLLVWGRKNGMTQKNGELINYFDLGEIYRLFSYETSERLFLDFSEKKKNTVQLWGGRASEQMSRAFELKREGFLSKTKTDKGYNYIARVIGDWRDIDVWALLVSVNAPVSPVYAMNAVPQHGGKQAYPRTQWYCFPEIFNAPYYKWLSYYAPALLAEMLDYFPEIRQRFAK